MRFVLIVFAILICGSLDAQDIIVRITGDTLHVKVDSQNDTFVYYISHDSKRGELDVISRKEIAQVIYNFESPNDQLRRKSNAKLRDYQFIQVYGQFLGYYSKNDEIPKGDLEEYYTDLQYGAGYKVGANYFFTKQIGVGLTYALSKFSNSVPVTYPPTGAYGKLSDNLRINYFGASAEFRFNLGSWDTNFSISVGAGMNYYRNEAKVIYGYELKANDFGFQASGSFNLSLGGGLYLPITLGYIGNTVGNFSLKMDANMPDEFKESLEMSTSEGNSLGVGRIFVGVGLSFAF